MLCSIHVGLDDELENIQNLMVVIFKRAKFLTIWLHILYSIFSRGKSQSDGIWTIYLPGA